MDEKNEIDIDDHINFVYDGFLHNDAGCPDTRPH